MRNILTPESYNAALSEGGHLLRGLIYQHQAKVHLSLAPKLCASRAKKEARQIMRLPSRAQRTASRVAEAPARYGRSAKPSASPRTAEAPPHHSPP